MGFDPRDPADARGSHRLTSRQLLAGTGGLVLARLMVLDSNGAQAQATPVVSASPTTGSGAPEVPINLAMTAPIPIGDLKNYAYSSQEIRTPDSFYDFPAYLANSFPPDISRAAGALNPEFCVMTSLTTPVTDDANKITRMLDSLTLVPPSGSAPNWDSLFAAVTNGAPASSAIGERNVVWTSDSAFTEKSPPTPIKATSMLFARGRYAIVLNIRDVKTPATAAEIAAIAKTIDDRIADALALKITPAMRMVTPLIDFSKLLPQPASGASLPSISQIGLTFRAIDGQLLRGAFESDGQFAIMQSGDKTAVANANAISYKIALDQKASIIIANIGVPSARSRDAIFASYFPDLAKRVDYHGSNTTLTVEQYSFPESSNADAVFAMFDDRMKIDIDHIYKPIDIPVAKNAARSNGAPEELKHAPSPIAANIVHVKSTAHATAPNSSSTQAVG